MGAGKHGGFGHTKGSGKISLPSNASQLKHIFRDKEGHLPDSPENRKLLEDLANDNSKFRGTDKWGNSWNAQELEDGSQIWVRYQNGVINEGGKNNTPRLWDSETGFNYNPNSNQSYNYENPFIKEENKA